MFQHNKQWCSVQKYIFLQRKECGFKCVYIFHSCKREISDTCTGILLDRNKADKTGTDFNASTILKNTYNINIYRERKKLLLLSKYAFIKVYVYQ